jgi:signal transduction histidine kinase
VENVLSYARLEQGSATNRIETVTLRDLLGKVGGRLSQRAEKANMKLLVEGEESDFAVSVRTDTSAVEQILFNLVENACKYASSASDRSIHLWVSCERKFAFLRVRDHGPGISKTDAKHLFQPFRKPRGGASGSAQGVGLGLALSRRLARQLGGDLRLDRSVRDGACFILSLALP